jgi:hypothetical protein
MQRAILCTLCLIIFLLRAGITPSYPSPVEGAEKTIKAKLGPFLFDRTTMKEASSLLGRGALIEDSGPFRGCAWRDPKSGTFLILRDMDVKRRKGLRLLPTTGILVGVLGDEKECSRHAQLAFKRFAVSKYPLASLEGPRGIKIGDTRDAVFRKCGSGQLNGKNGDRESYNWYFKEGYRGKPRGDSEPGFDMQLTFVGGRLVSIYLTEGS